MAAAKIQTVKGLRVEIFSRPLRKNTIRPLTVWIVGTDVEQGLFTAGNYAILGIIVTIENPVFSMRGVLCNFSSTVLLMN